MNANPHDSLDSPTPKPARTVHAGILELFEPWSEAEVVPLGDQMDQDLAQLEARFASFITRNSTVAHLRRGR